MQRLLFTLLILAAAFTGVFAQPGSIAGHIADAGNGDDLIGATVSLENDKSVGTSTDIDGRFSLPGLQAGKYNLVVSYVSYSTKLIQGVDVKAGEVTSLDVTMESSANELEEVVVTSSFQKENVNSLLLMQKNFASVSDGISADIIRKTPDKNTGEALKRISGVTIQNGRYVIVRGLPDRYNVATINGSPLPSTEPDRKVFSFDLIPAFMVDNIVIVKTAQPNLPGDFAGGIVTINTRDVPEENFLSVTLGGSLNTLANFNTWYKYPGGKTDWLGLDDGTRALPNGFPSTETIQSLANAANTEILDYSRMLPNDWAYESKKMAPLGFNGQLAGGFKKRTGASSSFALIGGLTYNSTNKLSNYSRYDYASDGTPQYEYYDAQNKTNIAWGTMLNLAYSLNENNRVTLKNSFTVNSDDIMTLRSGDNISNAQDVRAFSYNFIQNKLLTSQLEGYHFIPGAKIRIDWNGAYARTTRDQPDYRRLYYSKNYEDSLFTTYIPVGSASPNYGGKFYSDLNENNYSIGVDASIPFILFKNTSTFKMGTYQQWKDREFNARTLGYVIYDIGKFYGDHPDANAIFSLPPAEIFNEENISETGFRIDEITNPSDAYKATSTLHAYYGMFDNQLPLGFRIIWGARIEYFNQQLTSYDYGNKPIDYNTSSADYNKLPFDLLPSANLVYSLTDKINVRLAYSKTVSRPEFREVAPFTFYDFDAMESRIGNDSLGRTAIDNYDFKIENFFGKGQVISFSAFYKNFNDPIEQHAYPGSGAGSRTVTWVNADFATVYGAELELRKDLDFLGRWLNWKQFENVTFSTNLALIKSTVDQSNDPNAWKPERPLQGQSPYILNFGLTYTEPVSEFGFGIFFNQIGRRIEAVGDKNYPDIYEAPRPLLDIQLSKRLFKNANLKLNLNDILAQDYIFYQDQNDNGKLDKQDDTIITEQKVGANISLSFSYKF